MEKYSFYGRLSPLFPSQVIVDVTNVCNLECVSCTHPEKIRQTGYKPVFLSQELNKKMVDETKKLGDGITQYIRYTADGEPLLHPQINDILEYACLYSGTNVVLTTNGTLLDYMAGERLLDMGLLFVDISIDAFSKEIYRRIRRKGNFENVHDNVMNLIKMKKIKKSKTKIVVSFVEQEFNANEKQNFKEYWENNGVDYVVIRRLHSYAGNKSEIADKLRLGILNRTPCVYPWERIVLKFNGFLTFCPGCPGDVKLADYRTTSIKKIWDSDFYNGLRHAHMINNFHGYDLCANCPDWQLIRWPDEGRSYADLISDFNDTPQIVKQK